MADSNSTSGSASESPRSILQRLIASRNRDLSLLYPLILGFTSSPSDPDSIPAHSDTDPVRNSLDNPTPDESTRRESILMFNSILQPRTDPVDNSANHPTPDESTRRERVIMFDTLTQAVTDPDNNRVESPQTDSDPDTNSRNYQSPDESIRRGRVFMFNSLLQPETDPDNTRVESSVTDTNPDTNSRNNRSPDESTRREGIILFNPETQSIVVMEGIGLNSMFNSADIKAGQPPATKSSVEDLPRVEITDDGDDKGKDCVICLEEFKTGNIVKKMPCQHEFHEKCIEKWLGIHGSCPVCRYKMPVDIVEGKNGSGESEIWIRVSIRRSRGLRTVA